ncbi:MAG: hypothetical protein JWM59_729 [Verrucomicrobiales bacterium]|nr:hypothetical protein [Verrucomicrobiales bacterium]
MASIQQRTQGGNYYAFFRDAGGKRACKCTGTTDRSQAFAMACQWEWDAGGLRGFVVPFKKGKPVWPKPAPEPTKAEERNSDAETVVRVIVDAAAEIARREGFNDMEKQQFWLPADVVLEMVPEDHPQRAHIEGCHQIAEDGRIYVSWPKLGWREPQSEDEERNNPMLIVGLIMKKILSGDALFFEAMAREVREAKARKQNHDHFDNIVGSVASERCSPSGFGGPQRDWFTEAKPPAVRSKVPYAIWKFCRSRYKNGEMPTRRDIRDHLQAEGVRCANLKTTLKRLGLEGLPEGLRPRL